MENEKALKVFVLVLFSVVDETRTREILNNKTNFLKNNSNNAPYLEKLKIHQSKTTPVSILK